MKITEQTMRELLTMPSTIAELISPTKRIYKPVYTDISGERFERLVVESYSHSALKKGGTKEAYWNCRCDCGKTRVVTTNNLRSGNTISCGCARDGCSIRHGHTIGGYHTRTYHAWANMIQRCENQNIPDYRNYGGRGIKVCDDWHVFDSFLKDMGDSPAGLFLDRINNNGNYCKDNCRWVDRKASNTNKRNNLVIHFRGKSQAASLWADELGIPSRIIYSRYASGDTTPERLFRPIRRQSNSP